MGLILILIFFPSFSIFQVKIIICVRDFSGGVEARTLKLCIHMDNELLFSEIENRTHCFYLPFICSFSVFWAICVPQLSRELFRFLKKSLS